MAGTPYARREFAGGAISSTIPTGMGSTDASFTLFTATNWPAGGASGNFYVVVDRGLTSEEKILCSGTSGLVVTVASGGRGADGTTAVAHSANCTVQVCHVAQDDDEANQVVAAVLGQSGAAKGDLLTMLSAAGPNTLERVAIGTAGQVLGVSAGIPAWGAPPNPTLAAVETIFTASGQLLAGTGSGTGALVTAGQAITIGATTISVNGVESVNVVASSAGTTQTLAAIATAIGNDITLQSGNNMVFTMPSAVRGGFCYCIVRQPASGTTTNTVLFTGVKWPGGSVPTMTTGASKVDRYDFVSDGTSWYGVITGQNFS